MGIPKLFQWIVVLIFFTTLWLVYISGILQLELSKELNDIIIALPLYLLISFACVLLGLIGYRVATFNDCEPASIELKKHIIMARQDLEKKKYKFSTDWKL